MNDRKHNRLYLFLMFTSLVLLLALQFFWLRQNYFAEKEDLVENVEDIFRSTIFEHQDSLIQRLIIVPIMESRQDSSDGFLPPFWGKRSLSPSENAVRSIFLPKDSLNKVKGNQENTVATEKNNNYHNGEQRIRRRVMRSLAYAYDRMKELYQVEEDSLRIADLSHTFQDKLEEADFTLTFEIKRFQNEADIPKLSIGFYTHDMRGDVPFNSIYAAKIHNDRAWILRQLLPLFFFAALLLLITSASFLLIYRSLMQQKRLTNIKNNFISNVTHELQTPITSVSVALEALSRFDMIKDKAKTEEYLEISKNELSRLSILVDKVLKMALFENKELSLHKEALPVKEIIEKILQTMQLQFEHKKAIVETQFEGNSFQINADKTHFTSVIYNVLDNALKYSKERPKINITVKEEAEKLNILVKDNGIGIPSVFKEKIFEKFFRVPNGNLHMVKGHGLGLSYVFSILKKHEGTVMVNSKPGEGSTFTLQFPKN